MDRYSMRNLEDLVVPNYHETTGSYSSPDMWGEWSLNSQKAAEKSFDFDVINNGLSGGLYSEMEMEMNEVEEEESKSLKVDDCFYNSSSSLHDFDEIQQVDDIFLSSILEDVPGNELDNNSAGFSSTYLDTLNNIEVPVFHYNNWETCQDMSFMAEDAPMTISDLCEDNMEELSTEEEVLQDLQRATEKLSDDTRKCFRDTFYRLARNSQQKSEELLQDRNQKAELETNPIDRAIASLTFNNMESNMRDLPPPKRVLSSTQR